MHPIAIPAVPQPDAPDERRVIKGHFGPIPHFAKDRRAGRILIDYKRNLRTATSVAPYSSRAHPTATVAVPVRWQELTAAKLPDAFTLTTVLTRVQRLRRDPWDGFWSCDQSLRRQLTMPTKPKHV